MKNKYKKQNFSVFIWEFAVDVVKNLGILPDNKLIFLSIKIESVGNSEYLFLMKTSHTSNDITLKLLSTITFENQCRAALDISTAYRMQIDKMEFIGNEIVFSGKIFNN